MKRLFVLSFFVGIHWACLSQNILSNRQIDSLVSIMSPEQKAGQMTQIDLGVIAEGGICNLTQPQTLNLEKLKTAIQKYHIGSILNVGCGSGTISLESWHKIINTIFEQNKKYSQLNIPIIYGIDAIHGANYTMGATLFPQQIGQAATWNPNLVKKMYQITAYETRASGIPWNFSPVLDLGRMPLWSRFFETFGEDVYLAKQMSKVAIQGIQNNGISGPNQVASCMKHFLGYSMPLSGKDRTPAWISDRELREYFLPSFREAINQGAKTVMINSGEINGTPVHINYDILTTLLRDELGFRGVAVTDWEDIYKLVNVHRVAATKKEAVKLAIMAGVDMSMTPNDFEFTELLVELIKDGSIPMSRIDASVRRILVLKNEMGLFQFKKITKDLYPMFGSLEHAQHSYNIAVESMTLLKNQNNVLPINSLNEKVLVCGPAANSLNLLNGAWTHTWQGIDTRFNTKGKLSIVEAMRTINAANISYVQGSNIDSVLDIEACVKAAKLVDKIVVCLGETPCTELPGTIDNLDLTKVQKTLVKRLKELNKPIVLVCCFNRPRIINEVEGLADAILYAYLPGDEGGRAISDCLFGLKNPSGKLPFTYPANQNALIHYDRKQSEDLDVDFSMNAYKPQFDFGFGLSYNQFEFSDFGISKDTLSDFDSLVLKVNVKNIGSRAGQEVVQLYYSDLFASITPSVKKLMSFSKISLESNETRTVYFTIRKKDLSFVNKQLQEVTEVGEFDLIINNQKKRIYVN
jgi:beta-glucosidase